MVIEARGQRLGLIAILPPTCHCDKRYSSTQGALTQAAGDLVAVQFRHANIQKGNLRLECGKNGDRFLAIVNHRAS